MEDLKPLVWRILVSATILGSLVISFLLLWMTYQAIS